MSNEKNDAFSLGMALEGQILKEHYRIDQLVARGGMAWLYRTTHLILQETMAVKLLYPQLAENPKIRSRFIEEAKIQFRLKHPHIVQVTDVIQERGMLGSVMEWIEGEDAKQYMKRHPGPLSLTDLWQIIGPILDALHYAHNMGLVHRDIKPANILLHWQGSRITPKLSDFGIAKLAADTKEAQTATGATLGTMEYMAPEQIRDSKRVDLRADIYSIGIMLYQMTTGYLPFVGGPEVLLYKQIYESPTPPRSYVTTLPTRLEEIILRCLNKEVETRFQSCMELSSALSSLVKDLDAIAIKPTLDMPSWLQHGKPNPSYNDLHSSSSSSSLSSEPLSVSSSQDPKHLSDMSLTPLPSASSESLPPKKSGNSVDPLSANHNKAAVRSASPAESPIPIEHYKRATMTLSSFDEDLPPTPSRRMSWIWIGLAVFLTLGTIAVFSWRWFASTNNAIPGKQQGFTNSTQTPKVPNRSNGNTSTTPPPRVGSSPSVCRDGEHRSCYRGPQQTLGRGICKAGTQHCQGTQWGACVGETLPSPQELCNNKDDNCDGQIDESFPNKGRPCIYRQHECRFLGSWQCHPNQNSLICRNSGRLQNQKAFAIQLKLRPRQVPIQIKVGKRTLVVRNFACLEHLRSDPISLSAKGYQLCQFVLPRQSRLFSIQLKPKSDLEEEPGYCKR